MKRDDEGKRGEKENGCVRRGEIKRDVLLMENA